MFYHFTTILNNKVPPKDFLNYVMVAWSNVELAKTVQLTTGFVEFGTKYSQFELMINFPGYHFEPISEDYFNYCFTLQKKRHYTHYLNKENIKPE